MFKQAAIIMVMLGAVVLGSAQTKSRPYKCGFYPKDLKDIKNNFNQFSQHFNCASGEIIASVGSGSGYIEVQTAAFVPGIKWTLQDIDSTCLNEEEFNKVLSYHETLLGKRIEGDFTLVIGTPTETHLPRNTFDRILLSNVYHELTDRKNILLDILGAIKDTGTLVIMERMADKPGQKHGDCLLPKLWEPDFIIEMESFGFTLKEKNVPTKNRSLTFYMFVKS